MRYSVVQPRVGGKTPGDVPGAGSGASTERPASVASRVSVPRPRSLRPPSPKSKAPAASPAAAAAAPAPTIPASPAAAKAPASPAATTLPAAQRSAAPPSQSPLLVDAVEDKDLVVTVAPSDWNLPSRDALVGHGAVRFAIAPGRGSGGTLMVRPLKPGEVAPRGSTVAVLVTLEEGSPLPRV